MKEDDEFEKWFYKIESKPKKIYPKLKPTESTERLKCDSCSKVLGCCDFSMLYVDMKFGYLCNNCVRNLLNNMKKVAKIIG